MEPVVPCTSPSRSTKEPAFVIVRERTLPVEKPVQHVGDPILHLDANLRGMTDSSYQRAVEEEATQDNTVELCTCTDW